jgi:apolipoprotein N-acyltransferase
MIPAARTTPRRILLSLLSGLLAYLAFPPLGWHLLAWVTLWPLLLAVRGASLRMAFLCGLLRGMFFYALTAPWVYGILRVHGKLPPFEAGGVLLLLVTYLGLYHAVFAAGVAWLGRRSHGWACFAAPFLWVAHEFALVRVPDVNLPWNLLGYAAGEPLGPAQVAALTGVYGLSFLAAAFSALLARLPDDRSETACPMNSTAVFFAACALLPGALLAGYLLVPRPVARFHADLVQLNFPQSASYSANWFQEHAAELDEAERLSIAPTPGAPDARRGTRLIIWPEVPAPFMFQDPRFAERAMRIAQLGGANFLVGVVEFRPAGQAAGMPQNAAVGSAPPLTPRNSATLISPTGQRLYTYDKVHLVPFGEYVPWREWLAWAGPLVAEVGGFTPGTERSVGYLEGGEFATLICFEAAFPGEVRRFVHAPDCPDTCQGAALLVNLSNDGWFGPGSAAREQHLRMARMRAIENRRWLLRATNNGHTVAVDPYGRIVARLDPDVRGVLRAPYDYRHDRTMYTTFGDWFAWLSIVVAALSFVCAARGLGLHWRTIRRDGVRYDVRRFGRY